MVGRVQGQGISMLAIAAMLSACGGGGGGQPAAVAPPPAPPVATPPPPPPPQSPLMAQPYTPSALPSALNATVGLNQQSDFPTLSWFFLDSSPSPTANGTVPVRFGYDAATTSSTIALPGFTPGYLDALANESGSDFTSSLMLPDGGIRVQLLRPGSQNRFFALASTSVGYWGVSALLRLQPDPTSGVFAYGVPTAPGDLPATGSFRYSLFGYAAFNQITEGITIPAFGGDFNVDFSRRTVSGRFIYRNLPGYSAGSYPTIEFVDASISADGSFSGTLREPSGIVGGSGRFEGRFTGPQASEVMLRWYAPYSYNGGNYTEVHFGVFAGKRQ